MTVGKRVGPSFEVKFPQSSSKGGGVGEGIEVDTSTRLTAVGITVGERVGSSARASPSPETWEGLGAKVGTPECTVGCSVGVSVGASPLTLTGGGVGERVGAPE
jgi:hypothetical protein